jgi:hypothetical protein
MQLRVAIVLIVLHGVDMHEVMINPEQVTSLREARKAEHNKKLFTAEAKCMIGLTDGKFVTVVESCKAVRELVEHEVSRPLDTPRRGP